MAVGLLANSVGKYFEDGTAQVLANDAGASTHPSLSLNTPLEESTLLNTERQQPEFMALLCYGRAYSVNSLHTASYTRAVDGRLGCVHSHHYSHELS